MAEQTVLQPSKAPSLDTVVMQLTPTIERDYCARGVFPQLRAGTAFKLAGSASIHLLSHVQAATVLGDAEAVYSTAKAGRKRAYCTHLDNMRLAISAARDRRALVEAPGPSLRKRSEYFEYWQGTKEQLSRLLPPCAGFPASLASFVKAQDAEGKSYVVTLVSPVWPIYEVRVDLPSKHEEVARAVPPMSRPASGKQDATWPRTYNGRIYHSAADRVASLKRHHNVAKSIGAELAKYARGETYGCSRMAAGGSFELPFPAYYSAEVVKQLQQHEAAMRKILDNATPIPRPEADLAWQRLIEAAGNDDLQALFVVGTEADRG